MINYYIKTSYRNWMNHPNPKIRKEACKYAGITRAFDSVPFLIQRLEDEDLKVRIWAAHSLGKIGHPAALPALKNRIIVEENRSVRSWCFAAVGYFEKEELDHLAQKIFTGKIETRRDALAKLHSFANLLPPDIVRKLFENDDPLIREWTALNIHSFSPEYLKQIKLNNADNYYRVREYIGWSLGKIASYDSFDILKESLQDDHPVVRETAARSLSAVYIANLAIFNKIDLLNIFIHQFEKEYNIDTKEGIIEGISSIQDIRTVYFLADLVYKVNEPNLLRSIVKGLHKQTAIAPNKVKKTFIDLLENSDNHAILFESFNGLVDIDANSIIEYTPYLLSKIENTDMVSELLRKNIESYRKYNFSPNILQIFDTHVDNLRETYPDITAEYYSDINKSLVAAENFENAANLLYTNQNWYLLRSYFENLRVTVDIKKRIEILENIKLFINNNSSHDSNEIILGHYNFFYEIAEAHLKLHQAILNRLLGNYSNAILYFQLAKLSYERILSVIKIQSRNSESLLYLREFAELQYEMTMHIAKDSGHKINFRQFIQIVKMCSSPKLDSYIGDCKVELEEIRADNKSLLLKELSAFNKPFLPAFFPITTESNSAFISTTTILSADYSNYRMNVTAGFNCELFKNDFIQVYLECFVPEFQIIHRSSNLSLNVGSFITEEFKLNLNRSNLSSFDEISILVFPKFCRNNNEKSPIIGNIAYTTIRINEEPDDKHFFITSEISNGGNYMIKKKILFLGANPSGTSKLRIDEELRQIDDGLQAAKYRECFELVSKWAVKMETLTKAMLDNEPKIVHFAGHGKNQGIVLENDDGTGHIVPIDALQRLFLLFKEKVECVLLNACYSEEQAKAISEYNIYVVGMNDALKDKAAIDFSIGFYQSIGAGKDYRFAYQMGVTLLMAKHISQSAIPVMWKDGIRLKL